MRWGVVVFPGSNDDRDTLRVAERVLGDHAVALWHKDGDLRACDAVVLPGGFSYGDYLRCGALARFSPIMEAVGAHARSGGVVIGICNGFQILCEAGLLPGALIRNRDLQFHCEQVYLKTLNFSTPFTSRIPAGRPMKIPIAHGEGCYFADEATLAGLQARGRACATCASGCSPTG